MMNKKSILTQLRPFLLVAIGLAGALECRADIFRILDKEKDAIQCRVDLIQQAQHEILLSYYILNDDVIGQTLFYWLVQQAQTKKVQVKILIDALGSKVSLPMVEYLKENGVQIRIFNKRRFPLIHTFTHRMHDKLFIVDGKKMVVGGRNIKKEYYNFSTDLNFLDRDAYIESEGAIEEARVHFFSIWNNPKVTDRYQTAPLDSLHRTALRQSLQEATQQASSILSYDTQYDWAANQLITQQPVHFVHDDFFKKNERNEYEVSDEKDQRSTDELMALFQTAKHSILIENPYFVPTRPWRRVMRAAVRRGVKIRLLTNSIGTNDVLLMQAVYLNQRKKLLRMGLEVWEYQGNKMLHTKAFIIDDSLSAIGSYNIHAVSQNWNTEVMVWVVDTQIAKQHRAIMDTNLQNALRIGADNQVIADASRSFKPYSPSRKFKTFLNRYTLALLLKRFL
ncbi:MAG: phosphatidylserine/phosphatidylglycerophosphate/cardiolipin synthase family protein [Spirosomataceae bacterium]